MADVLPKQKENKFKRLNDMRTDIKDIKVPHIKKKIETAEKKANKRKKEILVLKKNVIDHGNYLKELIDISTTETVSELEDIENKITRDFEQFKHISELYMKRLENLIKESGQAKQSDDNIIDIEKQLSDAITDTPSKLKLRTPQLRFTDRSDAEFHIKAAFGTMNTKARKDPDVTRKQTHKLVPSAPSCIAPSNSTIVSTLGDLKLESLATERTPEGDVAVPYPSNQGAKSSAKKDNLVTVTVSHLSFMKGTGVLENVNIKNLFVAYSFLGIDMHELETPVSLPKPKPHKQLVYNFSKTFHVDFEKNYERRQYLASMLSPGDADDGRIRFTVVSEPSEDDDVTDDCEDVGAAYVSVKDILKSSKDIIDQDIEVYDIKDQTKVIGTLNVTVECLQALQVVEKEMQAARTNLEPIKKTK